MRFRTVLLALALGLAAPVAQAQEDPAMQSELERMANASPAEKLAYAESGQAEIKEAVKAIAALLEQAKKAGETEEALQCLTNRLTAAEALQVVAERSTVKMEVAFRSQDATADHEFRKIVIAVTKTRMLLAEAQRCSSAQAIAPGDTVVGVVIDDPSPDPSGDPGDFSDVDFPIPDVTPFIPSAG